MSAIVKPERIILKAHAEYTEKWVQARIAEDPKDPRLGDLVLLQQERLQPSGGRLDLLFQDADTKRRYEVELQLGSTDETHIIRTLEYWDIERKRYPQYDHCAVLIAEDVTSRFQNIVSSFQWVNPVDSDPDAGLSSWGPLHGSLHNSYGRTQPGAWSKKTRRPPQPPPRLLGNQSQQNNSCSRGRVASRS